MITFDGGSKFAKGGQNPLANIDFLLADFDRGVKIQGGQNRLGHRHRQMCSRTM